MEHKESKNRDSFKKLAALVVFFGLFVAVFVLEKFFSRPSVENFQTKEAEAAAGEIILLWDTASGSVPSGWTCISCSAGDAFLNVFPRASSTYGNASSGADMHSHTLTFSTSTNSGSVGNFCYAGQGLGSEPGESRDFHQNWSAPLLTLASTSPPYKNLELIKAATTTIPSGAVGMFDVPSGSLPSAWSYYSAMNGNFLRGSSDNSTGGAAYHIHSVSSTITSPTSSNSMVASLADLISVTMAYGSHTHVVSTTNSTASSTNDVPSLTIVFGKVTATTTLGSSSDGLVAMFDNASLPSGWNIVSTSGSAYAGKFLKGSTTFGAQTSTSTHNNGGSVTWTSGKSSNGVADKRSSDCSESALPNTHTHGVTYTIASTSSLPVYRDIIFGKYRAPTGNPPNAPTNDSPATSTQGVSTSAVFKMTATDPESDKLQYKVTIYSNSACTTVVQTNDQSSSQTGWSGQNATCSSGSDCYTSGTQGTFTAQTALSANTAYYWKASAFDPLGSYGWTDSPGCTPFTTSAGYWTTDSGSWSIVSNQLVVKPSSGSTAQLHASGYSYTNGVVEFKAKWSSVGASTGNAGGVVRADSGSNRYQLAEADTQSSLHKIGKRISDAYSALTSSAFTFSADTFYQFRGSIFGTALKSWINGGTALSVTDSALSSAGYFGLEASSTSGSVTSTFDNFAFYSSTTVSMASLPSGGSWAIRNAGGAKVGGTCATGSTIDISAVTTSIPVDYDNGGGSVAVWTGNTSCSGTPSVAYPASGLTADIFGGDAYVYNAYTATGGGTVSATSGITISAQGTISY